MLDKNQTSKIVNFAKARPDISAIYLFGSHAIGHPRSKSDIDLGILFKVGIQFTQPTTRYRLQTLRTIRLLFPN